MGKLMALALLCTMAAAVLFQPVLMGPPRQIQTRSLRRTVARVPRNEAYPHLTLDRTARSNDNNQ